MKKLLIDTLLVLPLLFSGCTSIVEVPVYIKAECPYIQPLNKVAPIELTIDAQGTISGKSMTSVLEGAKALRASETYYLDTITQYNTEFGTK